MKKILLLFVFLILANEAKPQLILRYAENRYKILNYPDAIPFFKYYVSKRDTNDIISIRKLAECYRLTNQYKEAEIWYAKLIQKDTLTADRNFYADAVLRNKKRIGIIDTVNIKIKKLPFNSEISEFCPSIYKDKLIFTSSIQVKPFIQRNHTWTETNFVSLQETGLNDFFLTYKPFALELRDKFNLGPVSFLEKDSTMYYTTNNPKIKSKKNGFVNLRIQSAEFIYGRWINIDKFPYNSVEYACAHPSISKDGTKLFFSSNKPGGFGGMDIYVCYWINDSAWSSPKNLGPLVNTKLEEVFPFIDKDHKLYFASNGWDGLGGLDIYMVDVHKPSSMPVHLMAPINSTDDDFGLVTYPQANKGFFSSDRGKSGIDDDIYSFEILNKNIPVLIIDSTTKKVVLPSAIRIVTAKTVIDTLIKNFPFQLMINSENLFQFNVSSIGYIPKNVFKRFNMDDTLYVIELARDIKGCNVQGIATEKGSGKILDSVLVKIQNLNTNEIEFTSHTNMKGFYKMYSLNSNGRYLITFTKPGYFSKELFFTTSDYNCKRRVDTEFDYLKDVELEAIVIGKAIKIDNIYFDLAKWNIRPDAAIELDKIVKMMNDNPEIVIELSSHTDSRASAKYNEQLSDKRAKSSAEYIVTKGINANRITGRGYGEYVLINKCADGVKCSEKDHQQNRRTEFKVVGFIE